MDDERLHSILTSRAEKEIPDTMDIRNKIYDRLGVTAPAQTSPFRRLRLRWVAVLAALLIASVGVTYALMQILIQPDPGLVKVQAENRIIQIGETHDLPATDPLTRLDVTVDYAYADANRVAVGYRVTGSAPAGSDLVFFSNPLLTDAEGRQYLWLPTSGQQATAQQTGDAEDFTHEGLMSFDAAGVSGAPEGLDLTLTIQLAFTTADTRAIDPAMMAWAGETSFGFQVPFNPGRAVAVGQSASASDLTIEIQQVVISPSLARADLCLSSAAPFAVDAWLAWESPVTLDVNGQRVLTDLPAGFSGQGGSPLQPDSACRALAIPDALTQQTGTWTLTLNGFRNRESGQTIPGIWTFTFDVS